MNVAALPASDLRDRLAGPGLAWRSGPFTLQLRSDLEAVHQGIGLLYAHHELAPADSWVDFSVRIERPRGLRRWVRPQVRFLFDDAPVFEPLPTQHALPLTEWALNWCISSHAHQFLVLHAAVVARGDRAAVLPAPPGSGKSTLCAALVNRGWRLLSDELALIDLADSRLWPLVRPVSLKNRSIDLIADFAPEAVFSERTVDTHKGTVALMRPKSEDVLAGQRPARAEWVVLPRWVADAPPLLSPRSRPDTLIELSRNAFNLGPTSRDGFEALCRMLDGCSCHDFSYSRLDDAISAFDRLADAD
ncbi:MAG: HprK-related kinase A [Rubrivivax sp.]|nr:HprK-related kinase A [Rubrivivax sp.]